MSALSAEVAEVRRSVREFVQGTVPTSTVRRLIDEHADYDSQAWQVMSGSMGLTAVGIPVKYGGAGYTFAELSVIIEELGAALTPVPYLSSTVAAAALLHCGDDAARTAFLPSVAQGTVIATVALGDLATWPVPDRSAIVATRPAAGSEYRVSGRADFVPDAGAAGLLLVVAALADGWGLFSVEPAATAVQRRRHAELDPTRPLYALAFTDAPAALLGCGPADWPGMLQLTARLSAALACEQVGGTARCLEMITDYVRLRHQFNRPIGSFQAIKHRCADLLVELEAARSIAYSARDLAALPEGRLPIEAAAAAEAFCADAYVHAAQEAIQMHGGIGFTWEHEAHLHLRRARTGQLLFGTPRDHRRALADAMRI